MGRGDTNQVRSFRHRPLWFPHFLYTNLNILFYSSLLQGELAAYVAYARALPSEFLALVDTYDTLSSGVPNFCAVALALHEAGYTAKGVRLDSGDLSYLSRSTRAYTVQVAELFNCPTLASCAIVVSNDINEPTLLSLKDQGHAITSFGVGTHLVTCQAQPALGCVYKLVLLNGEPRMKLSQEADKINFPGRKNAYRLYNVAGTPLVDLVQADDEPPPEPGVRVLVRHAFDEAKRAYVVPARVRPLYTCYWDQGRVSVALPTLADVRQRIQDELHSLRPDHKRALNPTPYKVSVSDELYRRIHQQWLASTPIVDLV
jgi:nicotinate phosphoribosyltransferase